MSPTEDIYDFFSFLQGWQIARLRGLYILKGLRSAFAQLGTSLMLTNA